jgi:hypothetical protein
MLTQIPVRPIDLGSSSVTPAFATILGEAAAVCFEENRHLSGVQLSVDGMSKGTVEVVWTQLDGAHKATHADLHEATESGVYGAALLLVRQLTGATAIDRSVKGGGFDWWIGTPDPSGLPFQGLVRLEVSCILRGQPPDIRSRLKRKVRQTDASDPIAAALISNIEFSQPRVQVERK